MKKISQERRSKLLGMKLLLFLLNLPYSLLGLLIVLTCIPYRLSFNQDHLAFTFHCRFFWWTFGPYKGARAAAWGHVVALGPSVLDKDLEHELVHVEQCDRYPVIYPLLYFAETLRHGYRKNRFEDEAYRRAGNKYLGD